MILPSIGRVVWVTRRDADGRSKSDQFETAQIAYVFGNRMINVGGFDRNGQPFAATSVVLLQDDDPTPTTGTYAQWMPYQQKVEADRLSRAGGY